MILGEIKRGCGLLADPKDKKPKFCSEYADKK